MLIRKLFPLNRCRRFARDVIDDTVDARHFIDDAAGDDIKDMVGDMGPVTCHAVGAVDGAQSDGVGIGSEVTHDPNTADVRQAGKVLPDTAVKTGFGNFFAEDGIGFADNQGRGWQYPVPGRADAKQVHLECRVLPQRHGLHP